MVGRASSLEQLASDEPRRELLDQLKEQAEEVFQREHTFKPRLETHPVRLVAELDPAGHISIQLPVFASLIYLFLTAILTLFSLLDFCEIKYWLALYKS